MPPAMQPRVIQVDRSNRGFGLFFIYRGLDKYEEKDTGIFVERVVPGGQASRCGVKENDKIISINDRNPQTVEDAVGISKKSGKSIKLMLLRQEEVPPSTRQPTECCCGCSIKTGCLIIGWLGVVGGVLSCALLIAALVLLLQYARYTQGTSYNTILYYIGIPSSIIQVIVSAILLYGIFKGQPKLLKIWIVYSYVNLGLSVKSLVVIIALVNNQILGLITLVSSCIGFALLWYFNKIVSAHRDNLVEGKHTGRQTAENPGY